MTTDSPVPVPVSGLTSGVTAIEVGAEHVCVVKDGSTWCLGSNSNGQLGNNSPADSAAPVAVQFPPSNASDTAAGLRRSIAALAGLD